MTAEEVIAKEVARAAAMTNSGAASAIQWAFNVPKALGVVALGDLPMRLPMPFDFDVKSSTINVHPTIKDAPIYVVRYVANASVSAAMCTVVGDEDNRFYKSYQKDKKARDWLVKHHFALPS